METYKVVKVVLPIALDKNFDYALPANLAVKRGMRVLVDFHGRKRVGIVGSLENKSDIKRLKPVLEVLDANYSLTEENMSFAATLSEMYPYAMAEFLFMMLPAYLKKGRRLEALPWDNAADYKKEQKSESSFIKGSNFLDRYKVWKEIVKEKLEKGSVLICFPQVSYLKEAKEIIEKDFPNNTKVVYSQQSEKELFANWKETRSRTLILGTRVAAFYYPVDLNLVVIEEENSQYYFQEEKPFYHLVDVISLLQKLKKFDLILSGDYPTLAAYKLIKENKINLSENEEDKKKIRVVDMGPFWKKKAISPLLGELLRKNTEAGKNSVILWNRKGFGSYLSCSSCGYIYKCSRCSSFLQLSLKDGRGICPYCSQKVDLPKICDQCDKGYIKASGLGIERIEAMLKRIFPEVKIDDWENKKVDTQIILSTSKILSSLYSGCSFNAGFLLDIDSAFLRLDYETTFNAFLYIQKLSLFFKDIFYVFTRNRSHYLFENLANNWRDFYEHELALRKDLYLPPFGIIAKIILRSTAENKLLKKAENLYNRLKKKELEVYGPLKESPFKLRGNFRYSLIVKAKQDYHLRKVLREEIKEVRGTHIKVAVIIR
jgi:primosomal protein N' (replication factor Y)